MTLAPVMTPAQLRFLAVTVERVDEWTDGTDDLEEGVSPQAVARAADVPAGQVDATVERLAGVDLLEPLDDGRVRPTVTARELLALDLAAEDVVCLDPVPE